MSSIVKSAFSILETPFKMVGNMVSPPKMPKVVQVPAPETDQDKLIEGEKKKKKRRVGGTSTILTSPLGLEGSPSLKKPTLLGV